jgi:uncharacterized lipoprotein NlpE involved in copper resistance
MHARAVSITIRAVWTSREQKGTAVKKTVLAGALVMSLFVVGCNNNEATPAPTEAPAAVESAAAEVEEAVESVAAEVEEAVESVAAEVEEAVESPAS